ncbi:MAG: hypothetical protein IID43_01745 [Planctomycetes bacterium]|nr:hypothetical protein [Planctomycetota bacterium]
MSTTLENKLCEVCGSEGTNVVADVRATGYMPGPAYKPQIEESQTEPPEPCENCGFVLKPVAEAPQKLLNYEGTFTWEFSGQPHFYCHNHMRKPKEFGKAAVEAQFQADAKAALSQCAT